ncbi:MAG: tetratricopeptide repeat protein [Acidobacteriota bacterium]
MKTYRIVIYSLCLILILLVATGSGLAQEGVVQVECIGSDGQPLKDVKVSILPLNGPEIKDKKSKKDGSAIFEKIPDGVYRVVGRKKDYAPAFYEYLKVESSTETASLTLNPGMDAMLYFEDPAQMQRVANLIGEAINASKEGRYDDAEKALVQANEIDPTNPQAQYYLGVFYVQTRNFDKAVDVLEKASELAAMFAGLPPVAGKPDPASSQALYNDAQRLIKNMTLIQGQLALQEKDYDKAAAAFAQAAEDIPNDPDIRYELALALTYAGKLDQAKQEIDKSIQMKPEEKKYTDLQHQISLRIENEVIREAQALLNDGKELFEAGSVEEALVKYNKALGLLAEDKQAPVLGQIGNAQAALGQKEAAVETYRKAAELAPSDASAYLDKISKIYLESKNYEGLLDTLTDPKALGSESAEKVVLYMFEQTRDRDPKLAEASLERLLKTNPDNIETYFLLGQMYYADGKEMDGRTKELLTKYVELGQDQTKVGLAKDMLVIVGRRSD